MQVSQLHARRPGANNMAGFDCRHVHAHGPKSTILVILALHVIRHLFSVLSETFTDGLEMQFEKLSHGAVPTGSS